MTTKKQSILLERLNVYLKRLGMIEVPKIIWTIKDYNNLPESIKGKRNLRKNTLGECLFRENIIFISYNNHHGLKELDDTLRHELIHYRFNSLPHGPKFHLRMKELKQGKTWPKYFRVDFVKSKQEVYVTWRFRLFIHFISNLNRISESKLT